MSVDCLSQIVCDHPVNLALAPASGLTTWKWLCLSLEKLRQRRRQSNRYRLFPNPLPSCFGGAPLLQPPFPLFAEAAAYKDTNCDGGFYVNGFHLMISPTTADLQVGCSGNKTNGIRLRHCLASTWRTRLGTQQGGSPRAPALWPAQHSQGWTLWGRKALLPLECHASRESGSSLRQSLCVCDWGGDGEVWGAWPRSPLPRRGGLGCC